MGTLPCGEQTTELRSQQDNNVCQLCRAGKLTIFEQGPWHLNVRSIDCWCTNCICSVLPSGALQPASKLGDGHRLHACFKQGNATTGIWILVLDDIARCKAVISRCYTSFGMLVFLLRIFPDLGFNLDSKDVVVYNSVISGYERAQMWAFALLSQNDKLANLSASFCCCKGHI